MNCCVFIGRLTADPELRVTQNGTSVTRFTLAVDKGGARDGDGADFFDIETWRGTAEFAEKYLRKGMRIAVKGEMHQRSYTDKQGIKRKAYTLTADKVEFADGKSGNQDAPQGGWQDAPQDDGFPFN